MNYKFYTAIILCVILVGFIFYRFPSALAFAKDHAALLSAFVTFFSVLVALYLGDWKERLKKPKLSFSFCAEEAFLRKLSLGHYLPILRYGGYDVDIVKPGLNVRVKIENSGSSTAKNVQARIQKIEFHKDGRQNAPTTHYHPTAAKWSGELQWSPIDIPPKSFFYLDVFFSGNETVKEILSFNLDKLKIIGIEIEQEILERIITQHIKPKQEIYWNVWVEKPYLRGLPSKYIYSGDIHIFFIVNAENCNPISFKAMINWSAENWDKPSIKVSKF
jgi:hypothetical protein